MKDAIDGVMEVMVAAFDPCFGEAWTRKQITDALVMPNTFLLLADMQGNEPGDADEISGFILSRGAAGEEELLLIAVKPSEQGRGIGERLLHRLFHDAHARQISRVFLEMRDGNPALALYRKCGFAEVGRRPNYYRRGTGRPLDAVTLAKLIL